MFLGKSLRRWCGLAIINSLSLANWPTELFRSSFVMNNFHSVSRALLMKTLCIMRFHGPEMKRMLRWLWWLLLVEEGRRGTGILFSPPLLVIPLQENRILLIIYDFFFIAEITKSYSKNSSLCLLSESTNGKDFCGR